MIPWHERRGPYKPKPEKHKTRSRLYIESCKKHNLSMKEEYLTYNDVAKAINMNTLEQRIMLKKKILRWLELGIPKETIMGMLSEGAEMDRHKLVKYYSFEP